MDSNTGDKQSPARPGQFVKGDRRINRAGRPKSFDAMRALSIAIAHEVATDVDGNAIIRNGHKMTVAEKMLWEWATSGDFQKQARFLEIAFGRVPVALQHSGGAGEPVSIAVTYVKGYANISPDDWDEPATGA